MNIIYLLFFLVKYATIYDTVNSFVYNQYLDQLKNKRFQQSNLYVQMYLFVDVYCISMYIVH